MESFKKMDDGTDEWEASRKRTTTSFNICNSLNPMPNAQVIHKSLRILIEKNVGDLGNRKRSGGHVGVSAKTILMKSTLGSMPAHGEC
jgi:hypothetical protein